MNINDVIVSPVITEKSIQNAQNGYFTFVVANGADKPVIRNAVEKKFAVHVEGVSTIIVKGGTKRFGPKRLEKKLSPWKKAVVKLKKGEKIDLFDLGEKKGK